MGTPSGTSNPSPSSSAPGRTVAPLTGLPVTAVARRPALVVKVENSSAARPQSGLDRADVVVEELVEGGITRFAAVFQSRDPGTVGPVRSLRDVDAALASPTRGLLASSGAAGVVLRRLRKAPVQLLTPSDPSSAYFRSGARDAPHNLYARADRLWAAAASGHRSPPRAYLPFAADGAYASTTRGAGVSAATRLDLRFSPAATPRWTYDRRSQRWLRSEGSTPSTTAGGSRLGAANVLVLRVRTRDAGYRDPVGNPVPETVLTGSGSLALLSGGRRVDGTWHKAGRGAAFVLRTSSGRPLLLAPGTTWVELVPSSATVRTS
ncbi:DUF3048 domain-containing protein [Angustibacter peucedani]